MNLPSIPKIYALGLVDSWPKWKRTLMSKILEPLR